MTVISNFVHSQFFCKIEPRACYWSLFLDQLGPILAGSTSQTETKYYSPSRTRWIPHRTPSPGACSTACTKADAVMKAFLGFVNFMLFCEVEMDYPIHASNKRVLGELEMNASYISEPFVELRTSSNEIGYVCVVLSFEDDVFT